MSVPEDFIDSGPGDDMSYGDFLGLLESFTNAGWKINQVGAIRSLKSSMSPISIICEELMQYDTVGEDYLGAEALNLS
ncbi:MAG: hypothetical protein Q8L24_02455, partial [bacterium]|nr:hypothetical protein [bacterium]